MPIKKRKVNVDFYPSSGSDFDKDEGNEAAAGGEDEPGFPGHGGEDRLGDDDAAMMEHDGEEFGDLNVNNG